MGCCVYGQQVCDIKISNGANRESAVNFFGQMHGFISFTKLRRRGSGELFHIAQSGKFGEYL
jgi:hypothetical protein